jgi:hypothetical protein
VGASGVNPFKVAPTRRPNILLSFDAPKTPQHTQYSSLLTSKYTAFTLPSDNTLPRVTCSRPAPLRTLVPCGSPAAQLSAPVSVLATSSFLALLHTPDQPRPLNLHLSFAHSASWSPYRLSFIGEPPLLHTWIHEVVLPTSASRACHHQPSLSNDRRNNALAPGAFI